MKNRPNEIEIRLIFSSETSPMHCYSHEARLESIDILIVILIGTYSQNYPHKRDLTILKQYFNTQTVKTVLFYN